jgi:hypothetical protein
MIIICALLSKLMLLMLVLSVLNVGRHIYNLWVLTFGDEETKYRLTPKGLILLGLSISFIIMIIITGIGVCV